MLVPLDGTAAHLLMRELRLLLVLRLRDLVEERHNQRYFRTEFC
jgi:hypothetical protein